RGGGAREARPPARAARARGSAAARAGRPVGEFVGRLRGLDLVADAGGAAPAPAVVPAPAEPAPAPLSAADPRARLNRFFDYLVVLFGWLLHPAWTVPVVVLAVLAVTALVRHYDRAFAALESPKEWLPAVWLFVLLPLQTLL